MNGKIAIAIAAGLVLVGFVTYTRSRLPVPLSEQTSSGAAKRTTGPRLPAPRVPITTPLADAQTDNLQSTNLIARLLKGEDLHELSTQQLDAYLNVNRRSAASLLAADRATGDRTFLREAMEKYPNDPRVNFAAWFRSESPEERRRWLDTFKQSAPDNALANYLSAREHFKSGQTDQAVQELLAVGTKPMQDYSLDFIQNSEEAYRSAGYSEAEAKAVATSSLLLPQFAEFKQVGLSLVDLAKAYRQAGDEASAQATLQMASNLGQRLDGSGTLTLLQSLVGIAVQQNVLKAMDPNSPFGDSGQTVQNQIEALNERRTALKEIAKQAGSVLPTMSEQDLTTYFDRRKLFGDEATLRWAVDRFGQQ